MLPIIGTVADSVIISLIVLYLSSSDIAWCEKFSFTSEQWMAQFNSMGLDLPIPRLNLPLTGGKLSQETTFFSFFF